VNTSGQVVVSNVTYRNVPGIAGGIGADTLTGPSLASGIATWTVNSANGGTLSIPSLATIAFSGIDGLTGGTGEDAFEILPTGSLSGSLNGGTGAGLNSLSYSQWIAGVTVNLAVATAANSTAIAGLSSNIQIVTGGSGNDTLRGAASKATVLIGLAGNDTLAGGSQRDLLIGGVGLDLLQSANGDDLLVSGRTSFDTNRDALKAIYNEWNSARTFSQRTANIWGNGTGVRNNGSYFFNSNLADAITDTVFADSDADSLTGGLNQDWFFASGNDLTDFVGAGTAPDRLDN
jgi:Ca2+-binding RTX toxin-like protein